MLLVEEVRAFPLACLWLRLVRQRADCLTLGFSPIQRLAGATLLIFANKQDVAGALSVAEIRGVSRISVPLWSGSFPSCRLACETDTRGPYPLHL